MAQSSRRFLVVFAALFAIAGFLVGSSRSQVKEAPPANEVGRFQVVRTVTRNELEYIVFDTKIGCSYKLELDYATDDESWVYWTRTPSPLEKDQKVTSPGPVKRQAAKQD